MTSRKKQNKKVEKRFILHEINNDWNYTHGEAFETIMERIHHVKEHLSRYHIKKITSSIIQHFNPNLKHHHDFIQNIIDTINEEMEARNDLISHFNRTNTQGIISSTVFDWRTYGKEWELEYEFNNDVKITMKEFDIDKIDLIYF
jgi:hypothetical protein